MIDLSRLFAGYSARPATNQTSGTTNYVAPSLKLTQDDLKPLKEQLSSVELTSISQEELANVGGLLFQRGLINESVLGALVLANADFDASGNQQNTDKKFDALEYFDHQLTESSKQLALGDLAYASGNDQLRQVNQVLGVLNFFTHSDARKLGLDLSI